MSAQRDSSWFLDTVTLDEVKPKRLEWLWPERIPSGMITLISGNADTGKTTLLCDLIARFTTGEKWPDGAANHASEYMHGPRRSVLLLNAEDGVQDTLHPRLQAAKAAVRLIHLASGARLSNCQDSIFIGLDSLEPIELMFTQHPEIALMVIDPIQSYMGDCDINKEQEVRGVLTPLAKLAEKYSVTIIANSHLSKRSDVNALNKIGGAVALHAVARAAWVICRDHEDKTLHKMLLAKGNLSKIRTGMKFRIVGENTSVGNQPVIKWEGIDDTEIEEAVGQPEKESKMDKAQRFLKEYLTETRPARDVEAKAKNRGISSTTLDRAKKELGVKSLQRSGEWIWMFEQPSQSLK